MPYKSMQGKEIDLDKLRLRNETTVAVGNARVNARGDKLGPGGKIIKKREDIMAEYSIHPDAVPAGTKSVPTPEPVVVAEPVSAPKVTKKDLTIDDDIESEKK
jgi:hypothetical protein